MTASREPYQLGRPPRAGVHQGAPPITPSEYDHAEREALKRVPNRIIEASGTAHFSAVGYPTRVSDVAELWRYAEGMHDMGLRQAYDMLGGLTEREFKLVEKVTETVVDLTKKLGSTLVVKEDGHHLIPIQMKDGMVVVPGPSLLRAVLVYREIMQRPDPTTTFEVGPGSGYVGALLLADGKPYAWTDNAQAFVLWQHELFRALGVEHPREDSLFSPWWEWMTKPRGQVDVVTCNHALCEMHPNAFYYTVEAVKKMLAPGGQFLVEEWGRHTYRTPDQARAEMRKRGLAWGEIVATGPKDPPQQRVKTWDDLLFMWGRYKASHGWGPTGVPKSEDEKFLESIGGTW